MLAPDRVGYGASAGEARGLADNADIIAAFIEAEGAGPATVVAHSWSGGVAVLLATHHRAVVRNLVLVGAACTPDSLNALDTWLTYRGWATPSPWLAWWASARSCPVSVASPVTSPPAIADRSRRRCPIRGSWPGVAAPSDATDGPSWSSSGP